jgi:hypothetical protein
MLIKIGDIISTDFLTGKVTSIIDGGARGWMDQPYLKIQVTEPKLHWRKRNQLVRMSEVKRVKNGEA